VSANPYWRSVTEWRCTAICACVKMSADILCHVRVRYCCYQERRRGVCVCVCVVCVVWGQRVCVCVCGVWRGNQRHMAASRGGRVAIVVGIRQEEAGRWQVGGRIGRAVRGTQPLWHGRQRQAERSGCALRQGMRSECHVHTRVVLACSRCAARACRRRQASAAACAAASRAHMSLGNVSVRHA